MLDNFFQKSDRTTGDAAAVAAGLFFTNVNFDLGNAPETWIDNIDYSITPLAAADLPKVDIITLNIYRNILIDPNANLGNQLNPAASIFNFWQASAQRLNDMSLHREFSSPIVLATSFRYSIVGVVGLNAALAGTAALEIFVSGRIAGSEFKQSFYGDIR